MNKIGILFVSLLMFYLSYKIVFIKTFNQRWITIDFSSPFLYIPFGLMFFIFGILIFFNGLFKKDNNIQYTKCPKCKEVFNYKDIKDGKCPNCEDVDTIDLDEYFKKYPDELDSK